MNKEFSVFAQNLAYYNEGEIVGGWLDLPQKEENIKKYLKDIVKIDDYHEEYEIADIDEYPFNYESAQWASVLDLNYLATVYNELDECQREAVHGYIDATSGEYSVLEIINICMQVEKINYYNYDCEQVKFESGCPNEVKFGYTLARNTGLYEELERLNVVNFFDFKDYGEAMGYDSELLDNGYIDYIETIDTEFYTKEEIRERCNEIITENLISEKEENSIEI